MKSMDEHALKRILSERIGFDEVQYSNYFVFWCSNSTPPTQLQIAELVRVCDANHFIFKVEVLANKRILFTVTMY